MVFVNPVGKVSVKLPGSNSFFGLKRSNSSVGTKYLDGLRQPKSVRRTAKVRSFYGFGQPRWKSVRKTA